MAGRAGGPLSEVGHWTDLAACKGLQVAYFSRALLTIKWAKNRCATNCPVREQCLAEALTWESIPGNTVHGVAGGLSAAERKALLGHDAESQVPA